MLASDDLQRRRRGSWSRFATVAALAAAGAASGQTLSIGTGDTVSINRGSNLITNGSFENGYPTITPGAALEVYWAGAATGWTPWIGRPSYVATTPAFTTISGWTSAGSSWNYAMWGNTADNGIVAGGVASDTIPHGTKALYFGNDLGWKSSLAPTYNANGTVTFAGTPTMTASTANHANATTPVTLSQTVTTQIGGRYRLDFWASAEDAATNGSTQNYGSNGIFGLQVGGTLVYLTAPGGASDPFGFGKSQRYYVDFTATTATTAITFSNWGHFNVLGGTTLGSPTTELVLDDVILVQIPEPAAGLLAGLGALAMLALRRRAAAAP